jgi:microcystin-dependent protein
METYLGQLFLWPLNWAPVGWAICDGRILSIANNEALFTLLGTTYGGDGIQTFALPDLRGRLPVGMGGVASGTLMGAQLGQRAGNVSATALVPAHVHGVSTVQAVSTLKVGQAATQTQTVVPPNGGSLVPSPASGPASAQIYQATAPTATTDVSSVSTVVSGTSDPAGSASGFLVDVTNPYLAINYIMALEGIYPSHP